MKCFQKLYYYDRKGLGCQYKFLLGRGIIENAGEIVFDQEEDVASDEPFTYLKG